jgi:hypothetical protein
MLLLFGRTQVDLQSKGDTGDALVTQSQISARSVLPYFPLKFHGFAIIPKVMGKNKRKRGLSILDEDECRLIVHNPFGPRGGIGQDSSERGKMDMLNWLESFLGFETVQDMLSIKTVSFFGKTGAWPALIPGQ